jgi:hypothetical protein
MQTFVVEAAVVMLYLTAVLAEELRKTILNLKRDKTSVSTLPVSRAFILIPKIECHE